MISKNFHHHLSSRVSLNPFKITIYDSIQEQLTSFPYHARNTLKKGREEIQYK